MKRAVQMAVNCVDEIVGKVTVCWVLKMVVTIVGSRAS